MVDVVAALAEEDGGEVAVDQKSLAGGGALQRLGGHHVDAAPGAGLLAELLAAAEQLDDVVAGEVVSDRPQEHLGLAQCEDLRGRVLAVVAA